jgi:hypothetical protein
MEERMMMSVKNIAERRLGFGATIVVVPSIFGTAAD